MNPWTCSCCGRQHEGTPEGYGYDAPWYWGERDRLNQPPNCSLNADYCKIEDDFFVRGCIEIPIVGSEYPFVWGVWTSLSKHNFEREVELAENQERVNEPAYFGWLSTRLEIYPDTLTLKCSVRSRPPGLRPLVELQPSDHPLAIEQQHGITSERLIEIAEKMEHRWIHPDWNSGDR
jgi:hypothetical protein